MGIILFGIIAGLFLAYANGANDNFKGVATLYGSRTIGYKKALAWATVTTAAGSAVSLLIANELIQTFSGKGLVPEEVLSLQAFPLAVGLGAASTVMLATWLGFPISTTHAIVGALVGAGLQASSSQVNLAALGSKFFVPLLASPLLAIVVTAALYPVFRYFRLRLGVEKETCVYVGTESLVPISIQSPSDGALAMTALEGTAPHVSIGPKEICLEQYRGKVFGLNAKTTLDSLHFASAGAVSFARGLNDTPKIAAIMLAASAFPSEGALAAVAVAMAVGGLLNARKVAKTMALDVTTMNAGQGFTANLVTSCVVIWASRLGVPVSTTHISCGALFGIGAVTGQARWGVIASILGAWLITLPISAVLGVLSYLILDGVFS